MPLYLGIDIGTSGVRTSVIDESARLLFSERIGMPAPDRSRGMPEQDPWIWWRAVADCIDRISATMSDAKRSLAEVDAVAVDGTSGTILLVDAALDPVSRGLMYDAGGFVSEAREIDAVAPTDSIAQGGSSTLARLLHLQSMPGSDGAAHAMHQADWIAAMLTGRGGQSDENNVLKLGYDLGARCWPEWFGRLCLRNDLLPEVHPVGAALGGVSAKSRSRFGFSRHATVVAGTTDSTAAFVAAGASKPGDGVTSLGTTLAVKLLSTRPVLSPSRGVYSHRLFGMWLAGGASNTGGGVLLDLFGMDRIEELEGRVDPESDTGLDYYPLSRPGERFPVSDPDLKPRLEPKPADEGRFFQGVLEGIARIERQAYGTLADLGADPVADIRTAGGGGKSAAWTAIRRRILGCPVSISDAEASEGSARIALRGAAASRDRRMRPGFWTGTGRD